MVVVVRDIVNSCDTADQGEAVRAKLLAVLRGSQEAVLVSFVGMTTATTSFVNAAFVELLGEYGFDEIKRRLRIVTSTRQINDVIKSRLSFEAKRMTAAA